MVDQTLDAEADGEDLDEAPSSNKKMSGKKLVLFFVLPALLVLGGGFFASTMLMDGDALSGEEVAEEPAYTPVFFELPDMVVNLNSSGRKIHFLKISVSLELADEADLDQVEIVLPRIIDNFQVYLRELRIEDLHGSDGIYRLREELLRRVNIAAHPVKINDVLFKEMLVQ